MLRSSLARLKSKLFALVDIILIMIILFKDDEQN